MGLLDIDKIKKRIWERKDWEDNYWVNYTPDHVDNTHMHVTFDYQPGRHAAHSIQLCDIDCNYPGIEIALIKGYDTAVKNAY